MIFSAQYNNWLQRMEKALREYLPPIDDNEGGRASKAARYSILAGGKRIRPVLALATAEMLSADINQVMPYACALEMIHTYSLIHDDLPCMDNDTMRRGQPTCHVAFDEATAVLAGDLLLNRAYEILFQVIDIGNAATLRAAEFIARSAGGRGMIGGQMLDLAGESKQLTIEDLTKLHSMKTGALLKAPVLCAALLAGAPDPVWEILESFAEKIGLAFQIQDDILDTTADSDTLGKTAGKDSRDTKSTYVSLLGLDKAREMLYQITDQAQLCLVRLQNDNGLATEFLQQMTDYLLYREK